MAYAQSSLKVQQAMAGRIRVKVPAIRFNEKASRRLEECLVGPEGVLWSKANPKSASLVVRYDPAVLSRKELLACVLHLTNCKGRETMKTSNMALIRKLLFTMAVTSILVSPFPTPSSAWTGSPWWGRVAPVVELSSETIDLIKAAGKDSSQLEAVGWLSGGGSVTG